METFTMIEKNANEAATEEKAQTSQASSSSTLRDFFGYTSTHGYGHLVRTKGSRAKFFWIGAIVVFSGILCWQICQLVITFLQFNYTVDVEVKYNPNLEFPAVTVCNLNSYRESKLRVLMDNNMINVDDLGIFGSPGPFNSSILQRRRRRSATDYETYDYDDYWMNMNDSYEYDEDIRKEESLRDAVNRLTVEEQKSLGHKISAMLMGCTYSRRNCAINNFTQLWNYDFGNCYTFSSETLSSQTGVISGLSIDLFTEVDEYIADLGKESGMRVVIHDKEKVPLPNEEGFTVSAGFTTNIGIRQLEMNRLGSPYYDCAEDDTAGKRNIYSHLYPKGYSVGVCKASCYQLDLGDVCHCLDGAFPTNNPVIPQNLGLCTDNDTYAACNQEIWDEHTLGVAECPDCPQMCHEHKYITTISSAVWPSPSDKLMKSYMDNLRRISQPAVAKWVSRMENLSGTDLATQIRNNVLRINVYYEDLNQQVISQSPSYTWISFISNIGGLFGLWIGMSVLSICEWLELACQAVALCLKSNKRERKISTKA